MSKWKIKQEVDLVLLFEMFSIGKCKAEQANWYIFNEYRNWSEISQSNCTIHGRKLIWFLHSVIDIRNIRRVFRAWKWHSYNSKIARCLQIFVLWGLAGMGVPSCWCPWCWYTSRGPARACHVLCRVYKCFTSLSKIEWKFFSWSEF